MGIITNILNLFGCSGHTKQYEGKLSKENEEIILKSIEDFKNKSIYKVLTEQIIDTTSDENLLLIILDNLSTKQPTGYEKEYEIVLSWNKSRQAIYMIWLLETEIKNGGYNQFYYNSSGEFYKLLPEALRLVGANQFADLTEEANATFDKYKEKIQKIQNGTPDGFGKSYEDNPLNNFDTEFYKLDETENLQQIQVNYIRKNKLEFVDK